MKKKDERRIGKINVQYLGLACIMDGRKRSLNKVWKYGILCIISSRRYEEDEEFEADVMRVVPLRSVPR
jgi:hypothetical protein